MLSIVNKTKEKLFVQLIKTQALTGIDNIYFFKGGFWMLAAQIVFILSGILLSVVFAHLADKSIYGKYQFVIAFVTTFLITTLPGANTALAQAVSKGFEKTFESIIKQKTTWSLLGSFGILISAGYFYFFLDDWPLAFSLIIAAITFPRLFGTALVNSFYIGKGDFKKSNEWLIKEKIITTLSVSFVIFFTMYFVSTEQMRFVLVIAAYYCSSFLVNIYSLIIFRMKVLIKNVDDTALHYGLQVTSLHIIPKITSQIDKLLIPAFLGVEALAVYIIALLILDTLKSFLSMMQIVAFNKLVDLPKESLITKLKQWKIVGIFAFFILIGVIGLPFIIPLLYGEAYQESVFLGQIYIFALPFTFIIDTLSSWFLSQKKTKEYFWLANGYYVLNGLAIGVALLLSSTLISIIVARLSVMVFCTMVSCVYLSRETSTRTQNQV